MAAHGAASGFVGEHAVAVKLDVGNVIQGVEQLPGVENRHHAIAAIRSAVLNDARLDGRERAVALHAGLQFHNLPRASAMRVEDLFARVGDLDRTPSLTGQHRGRWFERDHFTLAAESAAYQRLDHADLRFRHLQRGG